MAHGVTVGPELENLVAQHRGEPEGQLFRRRLPLWRVSAAAERSHFELAAVLRDHIPWLRADGDAVGHAPLRGRAQPVR